MRAYKVSAAVLVGRFVQVEPGAGKNHQIKACAAGQMPIGISEMGGYKPPLEDLVTDAIPIAGEPDKGDGMVNVHSQLTNTTDCSLWIATGQTVAPGDPLKSVNATGDAGAAAAGDYFGALALQHSTGGEFIPVMPVIGSRPA